MELAAVERGVDDAGGGRADGLGEVQDDHAAVDELHARVLIEAGIAALQSVVGRDKSAILEDRIGVVGHLFVRCTDVRGAGVAPRVEAAEVAAPKDHGLSRPAHVPSDIGAGESADAHAVLDDGAELHARLAGHVPAHAGLRAGHVKVAESPSVPDDGGEIRVAPPRCPPVDGLEAFLWSAFI